MPVEFQVYHLMLRPDDLERRKDIHEEVVAVELVSLDGVMESPSHASRSRAEGPSVG